VVTKQQLLKLHVCINGYALHNLVDIVVCGKYDIKKDLQDIGPQQSG
jgi:hypothetical protein